ncbi:hypothetical protein [Herbidospora sp. RD11066]
MLEHDLKAAMTAETAGLVIAPDLAERVEQRTHRRKWRTRLAALIVPLLAAVGWFLIPQSLGTVAASPDRVVSVDLDHLPPGLVSEPAKSYAMERDIDCTTATWRGQGQVITLNVYRGEGVRDDPAFHRNEQVIPVRSTTAEIAGRRGSLATGATGRYFLWVVEPGLAVTVFTDGTDLEKVVEGISIR